MTVRVTNDVIRVEGTGQVGDAEPILAALHERPERAVDLTDASRLHSAIVQILIALRPRIIGVPADPFYASHIAALLDA